MDAADHQCSLCDTRLQARDIAGKRCPRCGCDLKENEPLPSSAGGATENKGLPTNFDPIFAALPTQAEADLSVHPDPDAPLSSTVREPPPSAPARVGAPASAMAPFALPASAFKGPIALSASGPVAGQTGLRYADGVVLPGPGASVTGAQSFTLPYTSREVIGRLASYDLLAELGRGAMGIVYKAYSLKLRRAVAIKVIIAGEQASQRAIARFHNEAMLAARLSHPNIIPIFDSGEENGQHYFVMEFIEGRSLGDMIGDRSLRLDEAARLVAQAARALHYAHERGVVHRDVKPDNIMVDEAGQARIADFGLAKEDNESPAVTVGGAAVGTPNYMPPEQANGELHAIGPRSDVYALGATLYHALAGRPMFVGQSVIQVLTQVLKKEPAPPSKYAEELLGRELPIDLETACLKAVEKEAARRYASALAFAEDLEAFLEGRPIAARPIGPVERFQKLVRRNRPVLYGAVIVFSTLLTLIGAFAATAISVVELNSAALEAKDIQDALNQAKTVEAAIRVNMLQGRADQARELLTRITEKADGSQFGDIRVVRVDGSVAYGDKATKEYVKSRLEDKDVLKWIRANFDDGLVASVEALRSVGFPAIDAAPTKERDFTGKSFKERLDRFLLSDEPGSYIDTRGRVPTLVVVKPILNSKKCLACHGDGPEGWGESGAGFDDGYDKEDEPAKKEPAAGYDYGEAYAFDDDSALSAEEQERLVKRKREEVRAVLVMRRSRADLLATIAANRRNTLLIGAGTIGVFLVLMLVFTRALGLRLRRRRFGA